MKVIILNGPMGVGKTAVGKYIAETTPGTAFIDGDWCLDLHPFIGNRETKTMAVDNILHMIGNYKKCSECKMTKYAHGEQMIGLKSAQIHSPIFQRWTIRSIQVTFRLKKLPRK